jgi:hypothetical protein
MARGERSNFGACVKEPVPVVGFWMYIIMRSV